MSSSESQVLALLEAIDRDSKVSQRELASLTGLNVAKVNYLIKKLADKGLLKLQNISRNPNKLRYLYLLTPQGAMEKTRLAYGFIRRALRNYLSIETAIKNILIDLDETGERRIVVYGRNELSDTVVGIIKGLNNFYLVSVIDKDGEAGSASIRDGASSHDVDWSSVDVLILCTPEYGDLKKELDAVGSHVRHIVLDGSMLPILNGSDG